MTTFHTVRILDYEDPVDDPRKMRWVQVARKLHRAGTRWPIPVFRPLARRAGARLYRRHAREVTREIRIGEWLRMPATYDVVDLRRAPTPHVTWRGRLRLRWACYVGRLQDRFEESRLAGPWRRWIW